MTAETMNIHQGLSELKMLEKRINAAIREGTFVFANKKANTKVAGMDVDKYAAGIRSRYQSVNDLINRYNAIKRAIVKSNAETTVTVAGEEFTVAEAIEMKNHGLDRLQLLVNKLTSDYNLAKTRADKENEELDRRRADEYIRNIYGNTEVKGMADEVSKTRAEFINAQTMELVDPISIIDEIRKLSIYIEDFESGVDAALSTSNAVTMITVSY